MEFLFTWDGARMQAVGSSEVEHPHSNHVVLLSPTFGGRVLRRQSRAILNDEGVIRGGTSCIQ
jgi:hypothetical protein